MSYEKYRLHWIRLNATWYDKNICRLRSGRHSKGGRLNTIPLAQAEPKKSSLRGYKKKKKTVRRCHCRHHADIYYGLAVGVVLLFPLFDAILYIWFRFYSNYKYTMAPYIHYTLSALNDFSTFSVITTVRWKSRACGLHSQQQKKWKRTNEQRNKWEDVLKPLHRRNEFRAGSSKSRRKNPNKS